MRKPADNEWVSCPNEAGPYGLKQPEKVWDSEDPDGKKIVLGQIPPHAHEGQDCEWSGLPVVVQDNPLRGYFF